jgi:uncharacterized protein (TIGR03067 family)
MEFSMRHFSMLLVVVLTSTAFTADAPVQDTKLIQGRWKLVSGEYDGRPMPDELIKKMDSFLTIEGDKWLDDSAGKDGKRDIGKNTFKLDQTKVPKQLDVIDAEPEKGQQPDVEVGIYEIRGDTLKVCICRPGVKERPKEFKSADRTMMVRVYKREKAK